MSEQSIYSLRNRRIELEVIPACREIGHRPADVALAWVLANPVVCSPIVGPRTVEQLEQNVGALDLRLDETTLERLDTIWPGPGGEAPEAYAW